MDERQRKANVRLGLILASVALVFALGFVAKIAFFLFLALLVVSLVGHAMRGDPKNSVSTLIIRG